MLWLIGIVGSLIGSALTVVVFYSLFTDGTLRIDRTDPEKDIYRIDLNSLDNLHKKRRVVLKVDPNADLSQN